MLSKLALVAGAVALLATSTAWGADGFTLKGPPKIAFLYFKAKNDGGWTQAFDEARPKIEATIPKAEISTARTIVAFITVKACRRARSRSWPSSKKPLASASPAAARAGPLPMPANNAPQ